MKSIGLLLAFAIALAVGQVGMAADPGTREKATREQSYSYEVNSEVQNLWEISILLYGTPKYVPEIAEWNRISEPYTIHVGQTLTLKQKPIDKYDGMAKLLTVWRKYFGLGDEPFHEAGTCEELMGKGESLLQEKKYEAALTAFDSCRVQGTGFVSAWLDELKTLEFLGRHDKERELRKQAIEQFPELRKIPDMAPAKAQPAQSGPAKK